MLDHRGSRVLKDSKDHKDLLVHKDLQGSKVPLVLMVQLDSRVLRVVYRDLKDLLALLA